MNMKLLSIITFGLTLTFSFAEIKQVNVLFRHGDRTPGQFIKHCPNCCDQRIVSNGFHPIGLGGLTNEGKHRVYKFGKFLRTNYDKFLGIFYLAKDVEAVSSDTARTRMSLQLVLAGLYPPAEEQRWSQQIAWQPCLITYRPRLHDTIFVPQLCEEYDQEYQRVSNSSEFKQKSSKFTKFLTKLQLQMGKHGKCSLMDTNHLYHTFDAQKATKIALPDWSCGMYPNGDLREAAILQYHLYGYNDKLKRLAGGVLLRKIVDDMYSMVRKNGTEKIHLYSGHELNIVMLLQALGLYDNLMPGYSSAVIIELHEIEDEYFVKVLYHYGVPFKVVALQIRGCAKLCPMDEFVQILRHVIPSDADLKCERSLKNFKKTEGHYTL